MLDPAHAPTVLQGRLPVKATSGDGWADMRPGTDGPQPPVTVQAFRSYGRDVGLFDATAAAAAGL